MKRTRGGVASFIIVNDELNTARQSWQAAASAARPARPRAGLGAVKLPFGGAAARDGALPCPPPLEPASARTVQEPPSL
jgi:hypothetical protein